MMGRIPEKKCKFAKRDFCCQGISFAESGLSCKGLEEDKERCPFWSRRKV